MSKAISNGTLSLRFMQNAQRAKQQAQIEAEQAKMKDDAEWEVSQEVKDAWGIGSTSQSTTNAVTYESSYLPFLFASYPEGGTSPSAPKPKGRRIFNSGGLEVTSEQQIADPRPEVEMVEVGSTKDAGKPLQRLTSISGFKVPLVAKPKGVTKKPVAKTAQELIREDTARRPPPSSLRDEKPAVTGFMKPGGIDLPPGHTFALPRSDKGSALKRDRAGGFTESPASEGKKKKKKTVHMVD